ncbi:beta-galactosidase [Cerasicoccus maritimus]|uniref:beta-galactosidase n=1 Tax=Cerasicoccus maritimus TaxID=490089 RepID=UPI0028526B74|nr:beta-galactosidase [Cerasicoccus maritimus]
MKSCFLASLVCFAALVVSSNCIAVAVGLNDMRLVAGKPVYVYVANAMEMEKMKLSEGAPAQLTNVSVKSKDGITFASADVGCSTAEILYCFDFGELSVMPKSVLWQDRLTAYSQKKDPSLLVEIISEWSVDGVEFYPISKVSSRVGGSQDERGRNVLAELPAHSSKVYYRVRFTATGGRAKFVGDSSQWNRSGAGAVPFKAQFDFLADSEISEGDGVLVESRKAVYLKHIDGEQVYPEDFWNASSDRGWKFIGAINGQSGGIRSVEASGAVGGQALMCNVRVNNANPKAPGWLAWQYNFNPELNVQGVDELVFDIYPVDSLDDLPIMVQLGSIHGFGTIAAVWSRLGETEVGKWNTIRVPVKPSRLNVDMFRLTFNAKKEGVPQNRNIRFMIDNIRLEPQPRLVLRIPSEKLICSSPLTAAYLQLDSEVEVKDRDDLKLYMEFALSEDFAAKFVIIGKNLQTGKESEWTKVVPLRAPMAEVRVEIEEPQRSLGAGEQLYTVSVYDSVSGDKVAGVKDGFEIIAFDDEMVFEKRTRLLNRTNTLMQFAADLEEKGIVVAEPVVTLTVAHQFLREDGYVHQDYHGQKELVIASEMLGHISEMLDRADLELRERSAGIVVEESVVDYKPGVPIDQKDGRVLQEDRVILQIGPLTRLDEEIDKLPLLGFNAITRETRIRDWLPDDGEGRAFFDQIFNLGDQYGLAVHVLLSSHYPPNPMMPQYEGAVTEFEGSGMFPWDVLSEKSDQIFIDWYDAMFPYLRNRPNLASLGTANEPGYTVEVESVSFAEAFAPWARNRYEDIDQANMTWGGAYESFEDIDLVSFFDLRKTNVGAEYDWQIFVDEHVTPFFAGLKSEILEEMPDAEVWVKLMGHDEHFGFKQLNEFSNTEYAQTVLGTDAHESLWLDYMKSMNPEKPIYNTEWHFMHKADPNNQAMLSQRMFEGVVHGINVGLIWVYNRAPWSSNVLGMDQSITRWPRTIDSIGRTSLRLRSNADALAKLANLDGGKVRLMYSLSSNTHQGLSYVDALRKYHHKLSQNSSGVRFLFSQQLTRDDLSGLDLIAFPAGEYIDTDALRYLEDWVESGGTFWVDGPRQLRDPWGMEIQGVSASFLRTLGVLGSHEVGKGRVIVGEELNIDGFCQGPWAVDQGGRVMEEVEVRFYNKGREKWLSLMNTSGEAVRFELREHNSTWGKYDHGFDVWNRKSIDFAELELEPYQVMLVAIDGN